MDNSENLNAQIEKYIQELREFQKRSTTPQKSSSDTTKPQAKDSKMDTNSSNSTEPSKNISSNDENIPQTQPPLPLDLDLSAKTDASDDDLSAPSMEDEDDPETEEIIPDEVMSSPSTNDPQADEDVEVLPEDGGTGTPAEQEVPVERNSPTLDPGPPQDVPPALEYTEPSHEHLHGTATEKLEQYTKDFTKTGGLKVQLFTAKRTFPVTNGEVQVGKFFGDDFALIARKPTNESGQTEEISLAAPAASLSLTPNNDAPFALYDIIVTQPSYVTSRYYNIPIFEDIVSLQIADMVPKDAYTGDLPYLEYKEQEPRQV